MSEPSAPTIDALLSHAAWIRDLARRLVHDPDTADEIAQRTLIAAVERDPTDPRPIRAWLAVVVRNLVRATRRSSARRAAHEALAARPEALPSAHDVVERAHVQRDLVHAVLELDEPYRTVILLRFYEGRAPHEIAREMRVPQPTVRTQLARGMARLRARLDREHGGDRGAWLALLLPLADRGGALSPTLAGALLVNAKTKVILVSACALAALLALARSWKSPEPPETRAPASREQAKIAGDEPAGSHSLAAAEPARSLRETTERAPATPAKAAVPRSTGTRLRGKVVDFEGRARAGVEVALRTGGMSGSEPELAAIAVSAADGSFEADCPRESGRLVARGEELVTVLSGLAGKAGEHPDTTPVVVVAPRLALRGAVVDAAGVPLAGVRIEVSLPEGFRTRFHENLDHSIDEHWSATSAADGAWDLAALPRVPEAELQASLAGFTPFELRLDAVPGNPYVIVLAKPGVAEPLLRGRVVDAGGAAAPDARVSYGVETARTDEQGAFQFRTLDPNGRNARFGVRPLRLLAAKKGFLPARLDADVVDGEPAWPAVVTLRLGSTALSIGGRVLDHLGKARRGIKVYLADPTLFGVGDGPVQLESLLAGDEGRTWRFVETDGDGRFSIDGLADRPYTVRALEPDTLLRTEAEGVRAGTLGLELRMPKDALYPRVAGRVRGSDGKGVAGVQVFPMCDAFQTRVDGHVLSTSHDALDGTVTDGEGRFELTDVPRTLVYLRIESDVILPLEYGRYVEGDARFEHAAVRALPREEIEALDIQVDRRAHVQVELSDPTTADAFALLDAQGDEIELSIFRGNNRRETRRAPIIAGRSNVVGGSDRARRIVFFQGGSEVASLAVELVPGETKIVRL